MSASTIFAGLPNLITLGRLVLVPVIIVMISSQRWLEAFLIFVVAGVSDGVDGFIARRFDLRSELGAYLDPIADKALLISIYVALAIAHVLPPWLTIFVVSRDIMIMGAVVVSWLLAKPVEIKPLLLSKLNTVAQIGFAALVLGANAFVMPMTGWFDASLYVVAALTLASGANYFRTWLAHMNGAGEGVA